MNSQAKYLGQQSIYSRVIIQADMTCRQICTHTRKRLLYLNCKVTGKKGLQRTTRSDVYLASQCRILCHCPSICLSYLCIVERLTPSSSFIRHTVKHCHRLLIRSPSSLEYEYQHLRFFHQHVAMLWKR